jgi:hypothetical protein
LWFKTNPKEIVRETLSCKNKSAGGVVQGKRHEFKPQYYKINEEKKKERINIKQL